MGRNRTLSAGTTAEEILTGTPIFAYRAWLFQTQTCMPCVLIATLRAVAEVELTSVANGDARRTPRVDFNAQVELLARDERGDEQRVLVAQALDLGSGGIGLSMRE